MKDRWSASEMRIQSDLSIYFPWLLPDLGLHQHKGQWFLNFRCLKNTWKLSVMYISGIYSQEFYFSRPGWGPRILHFFNFASLNYFIQR